MSAERLVYLYFRAASMNSSSGFMRLIALPTTTKSGAKSSRFFGFQPSRASTCALASALFIGSYMPVSLPQTECPRRFMRMATFPVAVPQIPIK